MERRSTNSLNLDFCQTFKKSDVGRGDSVHQLIFEMNNADAVIWDFSSMELRDREYESHGTTEVTALSYAGSPTHQCHAVRLGSDAEVGYR